MNLQWLSSRRKWGAASAGLLAAFMLTMTTPADAQSGIRTTRHNLGSDRTNAPDSNYTSSTAEICVFCHTPHGAVEGAPVPLWNKRLGSGGNTPTGGTYISYATLATPSLDGQVAQVGSVSMACLSCHDGTQAMDNIINAPGSGGYVANGGDGTNNGNDGRNYTWVPGSVATVDATGRMVNAGDRISMLGTNLANDHPIGIQYCGGVVGGGGLTGTGQTVSGTCKDSDFNMPQTDSINGNQIFWVETGGSGKQRTDLPLYVAPRALASGGGSVAGPLVECASCHDPHVSEGQAAPNGTTQVSGATFLRISNAGSAVCTACHVK